MSVALQQELKGDPLALGYAALLPDCPGAVADMLNARTRTMLQTRFITARTIAAELSLPDSAAVLTALRTLAATNALIEAMWTFMLTDSGIDIGNANTQSMIDTLVAEVVFTSDQGTALKRMAIQPCTRAAELGIGTVSDVDVMEAWE